MLFWSGVANGNGGSGLCSVKGTSERLVLAEWKHNNDMLGFQGYFQITINLEIFSWEYNTNESLSPLKTCKGSTLLLLP